MAEITSDLELADVTEEQWEQARADSLVLQAAIEKGLIDNDTVVDLQLTVLR
jgi:hypothetical protein